MASKFNLMNPPKTHDFYSCFVADEGRKLIFSDFSSVEPRVLTHLSQDRNLLKLYGPDAKPHCAYLFTGANMSFASQQVRQYYDPENPTKEGISLAKAKIGDLRSLLKMVFLAFMYGAYPKRIHAGLQLAGYDVSLKDCKSMFDDFHHTYRGIKKLETYLQQMWADNGGWIVNGRGRPVCVHADYTSDIISRCVQSSAHDCLMSFLVDLNTLRHDRKVDMVPYLFDLHDSSTFSVADKQVDEAKQIYADSYRMLNGRLKWTVKISGDIQVGSSMADFLDD